MSWIFLIFAGLFEIGWPVGLKLAQTHEHRLAGIALAIASMTISGALLWLSQKTIPIGTAYAVWTGIGAAGTLVVGVVWFGDAMGALRLLGVALIVAGVICLKLG